MSQLANSDFVVKQADRNDGHGGGLTTTEHQELVWLRRENKPLQVAREIRSKAAT
jgi:hypothetical protein